MNTKLGSILACIAAANVAALYFGSRAVSRQEGTGRLTITYWEKWTGNEARQMRKVVDEFNKSQNKIFVKYLSISGVDQKTMLATAGGNPPDVAGIWQDQVIQFSDLGALTDLKPMADAAGLHRDYYIHNYYDPLVYKGKLLALPSTPASIALYIRPDLVPAKYASPETFPKTFEELDHFSDEITQKGKNGELKLAGFLPTNPGWWNWAWGPYFGANLIKNGEPCLNGPEMIRAFTWTGSYAKRYGNQAIQNFQSGFGNFSSPNDPFMSGKVATEMNGVWKASYVEDQKPGTPYFAVPFPYPADRLDLAGHSNLSQDVLVIPRGCKHVKEAFEFIRFVQRQDIMEMLCASHGKNSPLNKVSDRFYEGHINKDIRLFDQLARSPNAFNIPKTGMFSQISGELGNAFTEVNAGTKTPKKALDDAQERIIKLWKTYQEQVLGQ